MSKKIEIKMKEREIFIKDTPLKPFDLGTDILDLYTCHAGCPKELKNKEIVFHNVNGKVPHKNFVDYLTIAYNTDYGIVIKPDFIWFTILNEISRIINSDPEKYRKYFSKSKDKIEIVGNGNSMIELPVHQMMDLILELVPCGLEKKDIIPPFSTSDDDSRFAFAVSFLETVSPYYGLSFYGCMYNKIKILGDRDDYSRMSTTLNRIKDKIKELPNDYISQVYDVLSKIQRNFDNDSFWYHILWTESGYIEDNIDGWIKELYYKKQTWEDHISKIDYKELISGIEYTMVCGLLSSEIKDGYMIPNFQRIIAKKNSDVPTKDGNFYYSAYKDLFSVANQMTYSSYVENTIKEEEPEPEPEKPKTERRRRKK